MRKIIINFLYNPTEPSSVVYSDEIYHSELKPKLEAVHCKFQQWILGTLPNNLYTAKQIAQRKATKTKKELD